MLQLTAMYLRSIPEVFWRCMKQLCYTVICSQNSISLLHFRGFHAVFSSPVQYTEELMHFPCIRVGSSSFGQMLRFYGNIFVCNGQGAIRRDILYPDRSGLSHL